MENRDALDKYFNFLKENLFKCDDKEFEDYFMKAYLAGDNVLYQKNTAETKIIDDEWVNMFESFYPSIDNITRNPRSFIKYDTEITDVSRVKKTGAESVRHLASHTQYIQNIDRNNNVTPSKILTVTSDVDYEVYENRFIMTLIKRMIVFIKSRLDVIRDNVESYQKDHFAINSKFNACDDEVELKIDLIVKRDLDNKSINEKNYALLERVEKLAGLVEGLRGSQFMKTMKNAREVRPPIMKTNVILKNPDFRNAYNLWLFMDKYNILGYDIEVNEKDLEFDTQFKKFVDQLVLVNFSTILGNQLRRERKYNSTEYETYIRRRKKTNKKQIDAVMEEPGEEVIEDNSINEFFLNKYKQIFNKTVKELEEKGEVRHEDAVKRSIRKATDVVNSLFDSIFHVEEETDIFKQLVDSDKNIDKDYEIKKNQLKYAKLIREVKNVDLNKALRTEKKLIKDLQKMNNKYIKAKMLQASKSEKPKEVFALEKEIKKLKKENETYKATLVELENIELMTKDENAIIKQAKEEAINEAKNEIKLYEEELKKKEVMERNNLKAEVKAQAKLLAQNQKREEKAEIARNAKMEKMLNEEHEKNMAKLEAKKAELDEKLNAKLEKERIAMEKKAFAETHKKEREAQANAQKERERIAKLKVKQYEEEQKLKQEIDEVKNKIKPNKVNKEVDNNNNDEQE